MLNEASCLSLARTVTTCVYMRTLYPLPGAALGLGAAEVDELQRKLAMMGRRLHGGLLSGQAAHFKNLPLALAPSPAPTPAPSLTLPLPLPQPQA